MVVVVFVVVVVAGAAVAVVVCVAVRVPPALSAVSGARGDVVSMGTAMLRLPSFSGGAYSN